MTSVAVGCLVPLAVWLATAGALSWLLQARYGFAAPATLGVAAGAGLLLCAGLALLYSAATAWRQRASILGGIAGVTPSDGPGAVLVGTLEARGPALTAPMSGVPCLAYAYDITETRGTGKQRMIYKHFRGVALTPSAVVTPAGSFTLLTVPDLDAAAPSTTASERMANFERYARVTTFLRHDSAAQELLDQWADADGAYRSDVGYAALDDVTLTNCQLTEQLVPPGARVCVFGSFSSAKGGIVPSSGLQTPPRLILGSPDQVTATLGSTTRTRLILGVLSLAAGAGLVAAFVNA